MHQRQGSYQVGFNAIMKRGAFPVMKTNGRRGVGNIQDQRKYIFNFVLLYFLVQPRNTPVIGIGGDHLHILCGKQF